MDSKKFKLDYIEFAEVDDIWVRAYTLEKARSVISQHVHVHDHITLVSNGSVRVWQDDAEPTEFHAPAIITIPAGSRHKFQALTDNVVLCCLHNLRGTGMNMPESSSWVEVAHAV
jgi:quercetin dioxygenase-like cupin family protein